MTDAALIADSIDLTLAQSRRNVTPTADMNRLHMRQTAEEFEALYLAEMLRPVFDGLETDPLFGGGHAEKVWRGLLVDEIGREMAKTGGVGIADAVMRQLISLQEAPRHDPGQ